MPDQVYIEIITENVIRTFCQGSFKVKSKHSLSCINRMFVQNDQKRNLCIVHGALFKNVLVWSSCDVFKCYCLFGMFREHLKVTKWSNRIFKWNETF